LTTIGLRSTLKIECPFKRLRERERERESERERERENGICLKRNGTGFDKNDILMELK
jgi:hypothetical protein